MVLTGHVLSRKPFEVQCFDHSNHMGFSKQIYSRWRWMRAGKPCSNRLSSHRASKCCHICVGNQPETLGTSKRHHDCCQHKHGSGHATSSLHSLAPFQPGISCHLPVSKTQILPPTLLWLERRRLFMLSPKVGIWVQRGGEVNLLIWSTCFALQSLENKPTSTQQSVCINSPLKCSNTAVPQVLTSYSSNGIFS